MIPGANEYGVEITIDEQAVEDLCAVSPTDVDAPSALTFARNVFVPLTTACRYTCTYCTYFDPPGQASLLSLEEVREICQRGADAGCTEALFTFGDDPDDRYTEIHAQLDAWGYDSIHDYLRAACEVALEEGLLPHANPGDQTRTQMETVADVNASMGVMLETTADVDAHAGPRRKEPGQRLRTIQNAGELDVAFTTGILVGIGETWRDRAESLLAIRELHDRYDHVQEVIVQPVVKQRALGRRFARSRDDASRDSHGPRRAPRRNLGPGPAESRARERPDRLWRRRSGRCLAGHRRPHQSRARMARAARARGNRRIRRRPARRAIARLRAISAS